MYFFFWSHRQCEGTTLRKTLFTYCQKCFNNKKLAALRSQHHVRRHCSQFFIVETLLTVNQQCFTSKWRTSQWRWSKKKKKSPYDCKNEPPYPCTPAWRNIVMITIYNHGPKKLGQKTPSQLSFAGFLTQCTGCSTYPNYRPFWHCWHTIYWEYSNMSHCN